MSDIEMLAQFNFRRRLDRELFKFSMKNGGGKIDWEDERQEKYFLSFYYPDKVWDVKSTCSCKEASVYFISKEVAKKAIEEVAKLFAEAYPGYYY